MPHTTQNNNYYQVPSLESFYTLCAMALIAINPAEGERFKKFVQESPAIDPTRFSSNETPSPSESEAASSQSESLEEIEKKQKLIDKAFEYVAPSLFVTSVLALGELVGSTIWGISKYVSKDIIYNTLGATTAAVILQSADLVGYREEAQELFGIKPAEKRATVAITMGSELGKAIGALAGTSLTLLAESLVVGLAPPLIPYLPFAGLFIGGVAGKVIGAGLGAGLNNLLLSMLGTLPTSYEGITQKSGKFVERIKNSREVKRQVKERKASDTNKQQNEQTGIQILQTAVQKAGGELPESPNPPPLKLFTGNNQASVPPPNQVVQPASQEVQVPVVNVNPSQVPDKQQRTGKPAAPVIGQQRTQDQNKQLPSTDQSAVGSSNKEGTGNPQGQKKKNGQGKAGQEPRDRNSDKTGKKLDQSNNSLSQSNTTISQIVKSQHPDIEVSGEDKEGWTTVLTSKEKKDARQRKKLEAEENSKAEQQKKSGNNRHTLPGQKLNSGQTNSKKDYLEVKIRFNDKKNQKKGTWTANATSQTPAKTVIEERKVRQGKSHAQKPHNKQSSTGKRTGRGLSS